MPFDLPHESRGTHRMGPDAERFNDLCSDILALCVEIAASYNTRAANERYDSTLAMVWAKMAIKDEIDIIHLERGWDRYREDAEQSQFPPGYMDLKNYGMASQREAEQLIRKLTRAKRDQAVHQLSRHEYYVYERCYAELAKPDDELRSRVRTLMTAASRIPEADLPEAPKQADEDHQLDASVDIPLEVVIAQRDRALSQREAFLEFGAKSIVLARFTRSVCASPAYGLRGPGLMAVQQYLQHTRQIDARWDWPKPLDQQELDSSILEEYSLSATDNVARLYH